MQKKGHMQTLACSCYSQSVHICLITEDVEPRFSKWKDLTKTLQTLSKNYNKEILHTKLKFKELGFMVDPTLHRNQYCGYGHVIRAVLQSHNCCSHNIRKLILIQFIMIISLSLSLSLSLSYIDTNAWSIVNKCNIALSVDATYSTLMWIKQS
jgi:hypothetical protein